MWIAQGSLSVSCWSVELSDGSAASIGERIPGQVVRSRLGVSFKHWEKSWQQCELHKKKEAICLEIGNLTGLQASYGNQAVILQEWGKLEDAMALHKKEEAICRELRLPAGLRISLWNQANLLDQLGQHEEAQRFRTESEAIHSELMRGASA